ncbi:helix-turn-helix transcriptional regulator [Nocardia otitidiscaviarum]|uniref:helix-turn-helix transcriptional regulator n=1 Tax=Nocardia otitidiscaviarum TaxID=1823 RepID=UPI0004A6C17E|nr:DNA-binding protein [Nocardia otitidiscaviarum]
MPNTTAWLTRHELAARTKLSPKTLANWAAATPPKGPRFTRFGNRVRYRLDDVVAWENEQTDNAEQRVA